MIGLRIRRIRREDDRALARIIKRTLGGFGADRPGFASRDPEVRAMSRAYRGRGRAYFVVVTPEGRVVGGGGVAPLDGGLAGVCELRKMYFARAARGKGLGRRLLKKCLARAAAMGYRSCYLETLKTMKAARALYESEGFRRLGRPKGRTGHFGCDAWYELRLRARRRRAARKG